MCEGPGDWTGAAGGAVFVQLLSEGPGWFTWTLLSPGQQIEVGGGRLSFSLLQELYISHNEVSDVSVAAMLPDLRVLDLARYYK